MTLSEIIDFGKVSSLCHERKTALMWQALARATDPECTTIAEFGVSGGGSAAIIAKCMDIRRPKGRLHLFDSRLVDAAAHLREVGFHHLCEFHEGQIADQVKKLKGQVMFAHIDLEDERAIRAILENINMHPRGSIVVNGYGYYSLFLEAAPKGFNLSQLVSEPHDGYYLLSK